jgi:hypothetical protein
MVLARAPTSDVSSLSRTPASYSSKSGQTSSRTVLRGLSVALSSLITATHEALWEVGGSSTSPSSPLSAGRACGGRVNEPYGEPPTATTQDIIWNIQPSRCQRAQFGPGGTDNCEMSLSNAAGLSLNGAVSAGPGRNERSTSATCACWPINNVATRPASSRSSVMTQEWPRHRGDSEKGDVATGTESRSLGGLFSQADKSGQVDLSKENDRDRSAKHRDGRNVFRLNYLRTMQRGAQGSRQSRFDHLNMLRPFAVCFTLRHGSVRSAVRDRGVAIP